MPPLTRGLLPALLVWCAFALLSETPWGRRLEHAGFDALTVLDRPARVEAPIVIVGIDEPSFAELGLPWPWPRGLHAELIDRLHEAGAAVIGVDILFAEPGDTDQDRKLADAIARSGKVVLASEHAMQESAQFRMQMRIDPLSSLLEAGAEAGLANIQIDSDLVVRELPQAEDSFWQVVVRRYLTRTLEGHTSGGRSDGRFARILGPDHSFRYVSYYQALDPAQFLPPGLFADKIVLLGHDTATSTGQPTSIDDAFATPFSRAGRALTPGVELHANFVATALSGAAIDEAPRAWRLGTMLAALLLVASMTRSWRTWHAAGVTSAVAAVLSAAVFALFASQHIWLPAASTLAALPVLYISRLGQAYWQESRQRREIERAFAHYVAPDVVKEISAHPERLALGGVRRDITLMFTDLAGFTSVSESMEPEDVAALLNDYLTHMTAIVLAHGGTVDKYIGDAIMAFWGAPLEDPEQALHACTAARQMQSKLAALREEYRSRGLPDLHMRIGLHSGSAVVGNMGSIKRFDYTAIGDTVNLAARLEGINKLYGTEILLSSTTALRLDGRLPLRQVDRVIVKGKTSAIDIYTFCEDEASGRLSDQAMALYMQQRWDESRVLWERLLEARPDDAIATLFLQRTERFRLHPPEQDWGGDVALEKF